MSMSTGEVPPLDVKEAKELELILQDAAQNKAAVVIDVDDKGVIGSRRPELISPNENLNAEVRFGRHYGALQGLGFCTA